MNKEVFVEQGVNEALNEIKKNFEDNPDYLNNLPYHRVVHTRDVIRRTNRILQTVERSNPSLITPDLLAIANLSAAYHDLIQDWEMLKIPQSSTIKRKRFTGENEERSALAAVNFMNRTNSGNRTYFSSSDKETVTEAILGTTPGFNPDLETVTHPKVSRDSHLVTKTVALADVGTAGLDGPLPHLNEGDRLFREENLDILQYLKSSEVIPSQTLENYRTRILNWTESQIKFVRGRQRLFPTELDRFPHEAAANLYNLFDKFDATVCFLEEIVAKRAQMTPEQLLKEIGY